ncbi:shikimate dehydrogenase [Paralimibaculum aggregatum]|uniref:Shikimate dehydrogenase (NADP(+)) n=1 Tax=Paralimibaculum aggregatum TaxID=3036245 RepID=A0ABQ6LR73_9RHOB|nr:shikimate dehydrogenase [Limibaculum sp. NKW23]GMG83440.1 shikimate dehydrogenase [Limibaculum sp. NKW23]
MSDAKPMLAGVMGWPISHSKSPRIFAHWFAAHGIEGAYVRLPVRPEDFAEVYRALGKAGFCGVNVTLPHKEAALALADEATPAARAIGAANMIRFEGGRILADNTDAYGFIENLRAGAPDWDAAAGPALVLGAGGASRAVLQALLEAGCPEIRLANRTRAKAEALAAAFGLRIRVVDWEHRAAALSNAATLANSTALGMAGQPPLAMDLSMAEPGLTVTDIVYTPLETPLLAAARAAGFAAVDGLGMLLHQARPSFRAWFGADPAVDGTLRTACLA